MADQAISFSVGATSIGSVNTDSSGNAEKTYTANVDAGPYVISASFGETADYESSSENTNLIVEPFETTLVVDVLPSSVMLGDTVTIKATLKDEKNNLLEDMDVEFQINEKNAWKTIGSAKTDSSGIASIQYKTSTAGTLQVKAIFAGVTNYENSSAIAELVVNTSIALQLGIVVLVVAVVIVGLLIFASKRGMKIPFMGRKEEISPPSNPEEG